MDNDISSEGLIQSSSGNDSSSNLISTLHSSTNLSMPMKINIYWRARQQFRANTSLDLVESKIHLFRVGLGDCLGVEAKAAIQQLVFFLVLNFTVISFERIQSSFSPHSICAWAWLEQWKWRKREKHEYQIRTFLLAFPPSTTSRLCCAARRWETRLMKSLVWYF